MTIPPAGKPELDYALLCDENAAGVRRDFAALDLLLLIARGAELPASLPDRAQILAEVEEWLTGTIEGYAAVLPDPGATA